MTQVSDRVPEASWSGPVPGEPVTTLGEFDLDALGYAVEEWQFAGSARSWRPLTDIGDDGRWDSEEGPRAPFCTRLVVCKPADAGRFNGTVVVEWLNVSGGGDGSPGWFYLHRHLMREGAAWVGVSAQKAGIDGGGVIDSGQHLKNVAPERYGDLEHPGDAFSFDIFSQAGAGLRTGAGPLADVEIEVLLAIGESQSAVFLVTYANAVDCHDGVYDGIVIHGRFATGATLDGHMARPRSDVPPAFDPVAMGKALVGSHRIREDVRVPVMTVQSETDVITMAGHRARQPDNERYRLWEIAGAAHFDAYGLMASRHDNGLLSAEELAKMTAPIELPFGEEAGAPINSGLQQHYVLTAAVAHMEAWAREGASPPRARRLETEGDAEPVLVTDDLGIAKGGVRTPWVDSPVSVLSGLGQVGALAALFGTTQPLSEEQLRRLYPDGRAQYLAIFDVRLGESIATGFVLEADRDEIRALADASCPISW